MITLALMMLLQITAPSIEQSTWIAGQWTVNDGKKEMEEYWSAWDGKRFSGRSVVKTDDKITSREERTIERGEDGTVVMRIGTDKRSVVVMKLVKSGPRELMFESGKAEGIRRITLTGPDDETLIVRTERTVRGKPSVTEQQFKKQVAEPI